MSILDPINLSSKRSAQIIAENLKNQTRITFNTMVDSFNNGSNNFWNNRLVAPSAIADALGSDAREVFELHYALGQLIGSVKPESIQNGLSVIGQFTMNEDGTVTILPSSGNP